MAQNSQQKSFTQWLLEAIEYKRPQFVNEAAKKFGVTRQTVNRELARLVAEGLIEASGHTRGRKYELSELKHAWVELDLKEKIEEDVVWRREISPHLENAVPRNVYDICQHGFTEMLNNAISHSEARRATVGLSLTAAEVKMFVMDDGVGIFNKIQHTYGLEDPRHAIFELSKGKLTTDPDSHSGEGIFFASRMFDKFEINSAGLALMCENDDDWLIEVDEEPSVMPGTWVLMRIATNSQRTTRHVFERFAASHDDYGFSKTHIPVALAKYGAEQLVSRSQARRLLARMDRFKEVILDFRGIDAIGQGFADEIFRVFRNQNPNIEIMPLFANSQVEAMIRHVEASK